MQRKEYLAQIDSVIAQGPYEAAWQSLCNHPTPDWYRRSKLGVFIHWGIYSVPAFGSEWYSRAMYDPASREFAHHVETYGQQKDFGYKDFIPQFRGENFDAERWVETIQNAGAKYIMPVAEHHDGFAMYQTRFNCWNAAQMGPCRDVIAELRAAAERRGLKFCVSSHRAEHYFFMNMGRTFDSDVNDERYADFYGPAVYTPEFSSQQLETTTETPSAAGPSEDWLEDWLVRTCELIDLHRPKVLYFDWWIQNFAFKPYLKKVAAYYYNRAAQWGEEVTINYKWEAYPAGAATFDVERGALTDISPVPWQTCTAIGKYSWGYRKDNEYKSTRQVVCDLVDIVSKNGMLLLNIGPRPDGTFTEEETQVLSELGAWMKANGEGIYDTIPWKRFGEGEVNASSGFFRDGEEKAFTARDFRFTYKAGCVYAFQMRPDGEDAEIKSFAARGMHDFGIEKVELLESGEPVSWERTAQCLRLHCRGRRSPLPQGFKIYLA